ncbi:MAG: RdgB/HAM1 family non-canonical purine NTP pyrophosphatase [Burkholderiales bacterium]|jgi:XTP/dITP diphosphohydrolase|nr:RdgB/HAM1 family non-canonical purine NTP pyrophosphatase [Betaproteobacteria bacterium]
MKRLVLASNNAGKLRELKAALAPLGIEPVTQGELGIAEAEEPYVTFVENALAKARHASAASGLPALADDSGICVAALGGAPGVRSARFAGEPRSDGRNNKRLLDVLHGESDRRAWYHAVLVFVRHAEDPQPVIAEGSWHGEIALAPRGAGGFGYDPIFWLPERACTSAELDLETKQAMSHRGQALRALLERLPGRW